MLKIKVLLVGVNARFSHTNLAIRLISSALNSKGMQSEAVEFTINNSASAVASTLFLKKADILAFSCYIWNIEFILKVIEQLQLVAPDAKIILGGPEASNNAHSLLKASCCSVVVCGEGEGTMPSLIHAMANNQDLKSVDGICFVGDYGSIISTKTPPFFDLSSLPLAYPAEENTDNRIIYYESSRGCPYRCSYCLSANDKTLRFRSLDRVFSDLKELLDRRVMQVKFIDRTFNCDPKRAMAIWRFLAENDNGFTGFHFEVNGEGLNSEMMEFLSCLRPNLFQFEIGLQSTNPATLAAINRSFHPHELAKTIRTLASYNNIHLHLDLIAGLPFEGYEEFSQSFDYLYSINPTMIQLGFLKVLAGSPLGEDAHTFGIISSKTPPYQVLSTKWLSHESLIKLQRVEEAVEVYYNSGRFTSMLSLVSEAFASPFLLFEQLGQLIMPQPIVAHHDSLWHYEKLHQLGLACGLCPDMLAAACRFDIYSSGRPKKLPEFAPPTHTRTQIYDRIKAEVRFSPSELCRDYYVDFMPRDIKAPKEDFVLTAFDYSKKDVRGRAQSLSVKELCGK